MMTIILPVSVALAAGGVWIVSEVSRSGKAATPASAPAGSDESARLFDDLASTDATTRERALEQLVHLRRTSMPSLDVRGKLSLYDRIVRVGNIGFVYRSVHLLSELPPDDELIRRARHAAESSAPGRAELVAGLAYLESTDPNAFDSYFSRTQLSQLDPDVVRTFASAEVVQRALDSSVGSLVREYVRQLALGDRARSESIRATLLTQISSPNLVDSLTQAAGPLDRSSTTYDCVVSLLGEVGSERAFDWLLAEYRAHPSARVAISLGSSTRSLQIDRIVAALSDGPAMRGLLREILDGEPGNLESVTFDEAKKFWLDHQVEVITNCRKRSRVGHE